ncbi:hypothetical protein [Kistimonas asteriae]|uniref:hypothetical protein n=1 Tax=Kistimonas asteriae TaxID=517724 RepID=UPI001BAD4273|nr:hypothetical protein [Kistimonas asteriae]
MSAAQRRGEYYPQPFGSSTPLRLPFFVRKRGLIKSINENATHWFLFSKEQFLPRNKTDQIKSVIPYLNTEQINSNKKSHTCQRKAMSLQALTHATIYRRKSVILPAFLKQKKQVTSHARKDH